MSLLLPNDFHHGGNRVLFHCINCTFGDFCSPHTADENCLSFSSAACMNEKIKGSLYLSRDRTKRERKVFSMLMTNAFLSLQLHAWKDQNIFLFVSRSNEFYSILLHTLCYIDDNSPFTSTTCMRRSTTLLICLSTERNGNQKKEKSIRCIFYNVKKTLGSCLQLTDEQT